MANRVALVVGVTGVVGYNLTLRLIEEGWAVYGISRRKPEYLPSQVKHVPINLLERDQCREHLGKLHDVSHVFYTTWIAKKTEAENCEVNCAILENLIDGLTTNFKHFVLCTGTKHYMGPLECFAKGDIVTPFKERHPRLPIRNFYYEQEDIVLAKSKERGFTWSVARPHTIIGFAPKSQMNLGQTIAVYASICKHLNLPFVFPGGKEAYEVFVDASDTQLLAKHFIWEATTTECANQAFNVVNGDVFRWRVMWKAMAEWFDVQVKDPEHKLDMNEVMKDKEAVWDEIVEQHGLQKYKLADLVTWDFMNANMGRTISCITDMSKSREFGFKEYEDTEKAYFRLFEYLRKNKYIP